MRFLEISGFLAMLARQLEMRPEIRCFGDIEVLLEIHWILTGDDWM